MPDESSKSVVRRMHTPGFVGRYLVGHGIDIGAGGDPLAQWHEQFPGIQSCKSFDVPGSGADIEGDANTMEGLEAESYDFVHSAHCLEHMVAPVAALAHWFRLVKPGGHLIVIVPDEDLYEQGAWPSTYNPDHKATFSTKAGRTPTWSAASINVSALVDRLEYGRLIRLERLESTYRHWIPAQYGRMDQTANPYTESAIEFVVRKEAQWEAATKGLGDTP